MHLWPLLGDLVVWSSASWKRRCRGSNSIWPKAQPLELSYHLAPISGLFSPLTVRTKRSGFWVFEPHFSHLSPGLEDQSEAQEKALWRWPGWAHLRSRTQVRPALAPASGREGGPLDLLSHQHPQWPWKALGRNFRTGGHPPCSGGAVRTRGSNLRWGRPRKALPPEHLLWPSCPFHEGLGVKPAFRKLFTTSFAYIY